MTADLVRNVRSGLESSWRRLGSALRLDRKEQELRRKVPALEDQLRRAKRSLKSLRRKHEALEAAASEAAEVAARNAAEAAARQAAEVAARTLAEAAAREASEAKARAEAAGQRTSRSLKKERRESGRLANEVKRLEALVSTLERRSDAAQRALRLNAVESAREALWALSGEGAVARATVRRAHLLVDAEGTDAMLREVRQQRSFSFEQAALLSTAGTVELPSALLLNDTRTQNNVGCRATSTALIHALGDVGLPVSRTVTLLELYDIWKLLLRDVGSEPSEDNLAVFVDAFEASEALSIYRRLFERAPCVVINGEGSFYDRQAKGLLLCVLAVYASERLGRGVAFTNLSASLVDPVMQAWALRAFERSRGVWLREERSLEFVAGPAVGPVRSAVSADAAFSFVHEPARPFQDWKWEGLHPDELLWRTPRSPFVVLTGSSSLFRADRPPAAPWDDVGRLVSALAARGFDVVLYAADVSDSVLLRSTAIEQGLPLLSAATPVGVVRSMLAESACLISGRWHASILAATTGTPVVLGDANFFKTAALQDFLDLGVPMFDYRSLGDQCDVIVGSVQQLVAEGAAVREAVLQKSRAAAKRFEGSLRELSDRLRSS